LGMQFLRHIERTRLLVHMVDVSDDSGRPNPIKDIEVITGELKSFGGKLDEKPTILVASKIDVANKEKLVQLKKYAKKKKMDMYPISAVTGKGIEELKFALADRLADLKKQMAAAENRETDARCK
jgi:GTP-binding protein